MRKQAALAFAIEAHVEIHTEDVQEDKRKTIELLCGLVGQRVIDTTMFIEV